MARGVSETDRGMLASTMSDSSVAMMLGRSVAWVVRTRETMRAPEPETAKVNAEMVIAPGPASVDHLVLDGREVEITPAFRAAVAATGAGPVEALERTRRLTGRRPATERHPARREAEPLRTRSIEILKPVTPRVVGWARRFDAAGWDIAEVAGLFDVDAEALGAALEEGRS